MHLHEDTSDLFAAWLKVQDRESRKRDNKEDVNDDDEYVNDGDGDGDDDDDDDGDDDE